MVGQMLGHHRIVSMLGRGGMVRSSRKTQGSDGRSALKLLAAFTSDPGACTAEQGASRLGSQSPDIITLHEIGHAGAALPGDGYIRGQTLRERLRTSH
jgi:hypothetical protein